MFPDGEAPADGVLLLAPGDDPADGVAVLAPADVAGAPGLAEADGDGLALNALHRCAPNRSSATVARAESTESTEMVLSTFVR